MTLTKSELIEYNENLQMEKLALKHENEQLRSQCASQASELESLRRQNEQLSNMLASASGDIRKLREQIRQLSEDMDNLSGHSQQVEEHYKALSTRYQDLKNESETKISSLNEQLTELIDLYESLMGGMSDKAGLRERLVSVQIDLKKSQDENAQLQEQNEKLAEQYKNLTERYQELIKHAKFYENKVQALSKERASLKKQLGKEK
jgi:chromosome segregation ATPase